MAKRQWAPARPSTSAWASGIPLTRSPTTLWIERLTRLSTRMTAPSWAAPSWTTLFRPSLWGPAGRVSPLVSVRWEPTLVLQAWTASGGVLARRPAILSVRGKPLPLPVRPVPQQRPAAVRALSMRSAAALLTSAPTVADPHQPVTHLARLLLVAADPKLVLTASVVWNRLLER
jgi:hypothetical protein